MSQSMPAKAPSEARPVIRWRQALFLLILLIGLYAVLPQLASFRHSLSIVGQTRPVYLMAAIVLTGVSYGFAALTYDILAAGRLTYVRTLLVQLAVTFVNRLLPAGIGGIGTNYAYLCKNDFKPGTAANIVAVNNSLGLVGHAIITVVLLAFWHDGLPTLHVMNPFKHPLVIAGLLAVLLIAVVAVVILRQRLRRGLKQFLQQLNYYRHRPGKLLLALGSSMGLTLATVGSLWLCMLAIQPGYSLVTALLVFTLGLAIGNATPTPGGLGGMEAGLTAGLVAFHLPADAALAIALTYRFISYWLTLAVGSIAFVLARQRDYI